VTKLEKSPLELQQYSTKPSKFAFLKQIVSKRGAVI